MSTPLFTPEEVREWLDKNQITDILTRCARAADRVDIAQLRSLFHPDATDDHGGLYCGGIEIALSFLEERGQDRSTSTQHCLMNVHIELDGDVARTETYAVACHHRLIDGDRCDEFVGLRYLDRLERRDDRQWRIAARKVVWDWWRTSPVTALTLWSDPDDPRFTRGIRGVEDASYAWFAGDLTA
jgi:hypothetical protein